MIQIIVEGSDLPQTVPPVRQRPGATGEIVQRLHPAYLPSLEEASRPPQPQSDGSVMSLHRGLGLERRGQRYQISLQGGIFSQIVCTNHSTPIRAINLTSDGPDSFFLFFYDKPRFYCICPPNNHRVHC